MTQTLRRELRMRFNQILEDNILRIRACDNEIIPVIGELLADAALEVSAIQKRAELGKTSIEAAIFGGVEVTAEMVDAERVRQEAVNAFESAFGITRPWSNWWDIKKDWKDLLAFVVEVYQSDPEAFKRYNLWYDDKGKFGGGMNATQIRRDPALFFTAWDMFKRQDVGKVAPQKPTEIPDWKKGIEL